MQGRMKFLRIRLLLASMALGAVLTACNQEQVTATSSTPINSSTSTTDEIALRLGIKNTDSCKALQDDLAKAFKGVKDSSSAESLKALHKGFVAACVDTTKKENDDKDEKHPPELKPDPISHCRWMVSEMSRNGDSMVVKYNRVCPTDCKIISSTTSVSDSATKAMNRICIETKGHHDDDNDNNDDNNSVKKNENESIHEKVDEQKVGEKDDGVKDCKPIEKIQKDDDDNKPELNNACSQLRSQLGDKLAKKDTTEIEAVVKKMHLFCDVHQKEIEKPEVRTEPKPEVRTEPKPEVRTEPKPEVRTEPKIELKLIPLDSCARLKALVSNPLTDSLTLVKANAKYTRACLIIKN